MTSYVDKFIPKKPKRYSFFQTQLKIEYIDWRYGIISVIIPAVDPERSFEFKLTDRMYDGVYDNNLSVPAEERPEMTGYRFYGYCNIGAEDLEDIVLIPPFTKGNINATFKVAPTDGG